MSASQIFEEKESWWSPSAVIDFLFFLIVSCIPEEDNVRGRYLWKCAFQGALGLIVFGVMLAISAKLNSGMLTFVQLGYWALGIGVVVGLILYLVYQETKTQNRII